MDLRGLLASPRRPKYFSELMVDSQPSMRSYTPPPSVQSGYDIGAKLDPGTPGDKREVYRQGARLNTAAGLLAPPIGVAQGILDLDYENQKLKSGEEKLGPGYALSAMGAIPAVGKLPRLRGGYHATSSPEEFVKFRKSERDMGTHLSTDPNVSRGYAMGDFSPNKFLSDWAAVLNNPGGTVAGPRTMPVVADIRNPLKYPGDAINWQSADNVVGVLESAMDETGRYSRLHKDLTNIAGKSGKFESNFEDYLRGKGHDAVQYPHVTKSYGLPDKFNSFMALDPEQVLPKFSPEGIALAKERGVIRPGISLQWNPMDQAYWDLKHQGIMGKKAEEIIKNKGLLSQKSYNADAIDRQLAGETKPNILSGSAAAGVPKHLIGNVVDELEQIDQGHLLTKKLADMNQQEYYIYKNALTHAENVHKQFSKTE